MDSPAELETRLPNLVAAVTADTPARRFSIGALRRATAACLTDIGDSKRFGGTGEEPFWNLLMYDDNPEEEALFIVTVFASGCQHPCGHRHPAQDPRGLRPAAHVRRERHGKGTSR
jgi:hypothetical protein